MSISHWKSIRPWTGLTNSGEPSNIGTKPIKTKPIKNYNLDLILEVLDLNSTTITLNVFTPTSTSTSTTSTSSSTTNNSISGGSNKKNNKKSSNPSSTSTKTTRTIKKRKVKPPVLSVSLDKRPWPHVAHTGSSASKTRHGNDTIIVIYGLDSDRKYEVSLSLLNDPDGPVEYEEVIEEIEEIVVEEEEIDLLVTSVESNIIEATTLVSTPSTVPIAPNTLPTSSTSILTPISPLSTNLTNQPQLSSSSSQIRTPEGPPPPYSAESISITTSSTTTSVPTPVVSSEVEVAAETEESILPSSPTPSSSSLSTPTDEPSLRILLKKLRTNSKRTETVLNTSITTLKKSVEKSLKEDQRARTRMVGLEESIRKAKESEIDARETSFWECEEGIIELGKIEIQVKEELERRRLGKKDENTSNNSSTSELVHHTTTTHSNRNSSMNMGEEEICPEEVAHHESLTDIAKELDTLNDLINKLEKESRPNAKQNLKSLELELSQIENELIQLERYEAHYRPQMMAGQRSSDSFERYGTYIPEQNQHNQQQHPSSSSSPQSSSSSSFRWRRSASNKSTGLNNNNGNTTGSSAISIVDPRSFGRFFRRSVAANTSKEVSSNTNLNKTRTGGVGGIQQQQQDYTSAGFHPQSFAEERQSLWGNSDSSNGLLPPPPPGIPLPNGRFPSMGLNMGALSNRSRSGSLIGRSRSGSLNTVNEHDPNNQSVMINVVLPTSTLSQSDIPHTGNGGKKNKGKGKKGQGNNGSKNKFTSSFSGLSLSSNGSGTTGGDENEGGSKLMKKLSSSSGSKEKDKSLAIGNSKDSTTTSNNKEESGVVGSWSRFKAMRP